MVMRENDRRATYPCCVDDDFPDRHFNRMRVALIAFYKKAARG
jgi:hypothetical protein